MVLKGCCKIKKKEKIELYWLKGGRGCNPTSLAFFLTHFVCIKYKIVQLSYFSILTMCGTKQTIFNLSLYLTKLNTHSHTHTPTNIFSNRQTLISISEGILSPNTSMKMPEAKSEKESSGSADGCIYTIHTKFYF